MDTPKFSKTVIHLIFKGDTRSSDRHFYFGSVACIYDHFSADQIGITYGSLRNYGVSEDRPYENRDVIIRKGKLLSKDQKNKKENR